MSVVLVFGVVCLSLQRLFELVLARRNERVQRARGAVERGRGHYPFMVGLHALWLVSTLVEGLVRAGVPGWWPAPLALFLLAQPLRYWAIFSLGSAWNTKILVVPGARLVAHGPFRFVPHPNYVVVVVEILTFPLIFGAWATAIVFSVLNAGLLVVRIGEENRALEELAGR